MPRHGRARGGGGRIRVHERTVDDESELIGGAIELSAEHRNDIVETEQMEMADKTRREYRNRIKRIYTWLMKSKDYTAYFEQGTRIVTPAEKEDPVKFHHTNDRDLKYTGLNVSVIKAFLSEAKKKKVDDDGNIVTLSSISDVKKYDDAIKWGSRVAGEPLPSSYYREIDGFIQAYKKEFKVAQKDGKTDTQEADPITITLFRLICQWAVEEGNIYVWVFSLAMWNLMSRSISVDQLSLHNIKSGASDSIKFKYDETKADKTGEFVQEKNCYANPVEANVCFFLSLGVWISMGAERLEDTEKLFLRPGAKAGSASQRYCNQLSELVVRHQKEAKHHLRVSHFNAHGIRKGSGSHASSATTSPPSFVSVAARGEWSIGKILDVYFKFAMGGDQYLGRILSLLDPGKDTFAMLPPHWRDPTHPTVLLGIKIAFRNVLVKHEDTSHDPTGLLSLLLASMVHHSTWLLEKCAEHPDHPFHAIPILNHEILPVLKSEHLTLEPSPHVPIATGVPPHVAHSRDIKEVKVLCMETKDTVADFRADLKAAVFDAVDAKVRAEGAVNQAVLQNLLDGLKEELFERLESLAIQSSNAVPAYEPNASSIDLRARLAGPFEFKYKGSSWPIPESFQFASGMTRLNGWRQWLLGSIHVAGGRSWRLKPYRKFSGRDLHSKALKDAYRFEWKPVFSAMMEAPGLSIPSDRDKIDEAFLQSSYAIATDHLKSRFSYIFRKPAAVVSSYTIGTWSQKTRPHVVRKCGTDSDVARLPPATTRNNPHRTKRTFTQQRRRRVRKVAKAGAGKRAAMALVESEEEEGHGEHEEEVELTDFSS